MENINRSSIISKLFIDAKIPSRGDKKYFSLSRVCKDYFGVTVNEFVAENPDAKLFQEKGKKSFYISPQNLLPCLEKSDKPKAKKFIDEVNEIVNEEIRRIANAAKLKAIDDKISVSDHIDYVNNKITEDANVIPGELTGVGPNAVKLTLVAADDLEFIKATKCPSHTHSVFKKLSIPIFKFTFNDKSTYYIRHVTMTKYFSGCQLSTHVIDLDVSVVNSRGKISTVEKDKNDKIICFDVNDAKEKTKIDDMRKFNSIDKNFFRDIKDISADNPLAYSMQRQLWPDDESYFEEATNRYEFETLHNIIMKMSDTFYFDFQKRFCTHRVDALLYRKGKFTNSPRTICVEVDENNHKDRDAEDEELKSNYIKTCGYALFRFPVNKSNSLAQIELIADQAVKDIYEFSKKDVVLRSPQLILDSIKKHVVDKNVQEDFVRLFFDKISNRTGPFIYRHTEVGEYFNYSPSRSYEGFREFIKKNYEKGVNYIEIIENQTSMIYITALTFNFICIDVPSTEITRKISQEFCIVYQLCYEYLLTLIEINNGNASHIHQYADNETVIAEANKMVKATVVNLKKDFEVEKQKMLKRYDEAVALFYTIKSNNDELSSRNAELIREQAKYVREMDKMSVDLLNARTEISMLQDKLRSSMRAEELANGYTKKIQLEKEEAEERAIEAEKKKREAEALVIQLKEQLKKYADLGDEHVEVKSVLPRKRKTTAKKEPLSKKNTTSKSSSHR